MCNNILVDEQDQHQASLDSATNAGLQLNEEAVPFIDLVESIHARLRKEARNAPVTLDPFLDRQQLRIDPAEYLRSALAL